MTFCDRCGYRLDEGAVLCGGCGSDVEVERSPVPLHLDVPRPAPELEVSGPPCAQHPGMPLVGSCPRCKREVCIRCAPEAARDDFTCTDCVGLSEAHRAAPLDAMCAAHQQTRASFICARCGTFACTACALPGSHQQGLCVRCGTNVGELASRGSRFVANFIDDLAVLGPLVLTWLVLASERSWWGPETAGLSVFLLFVALAVGCVAQVVAQVAWGQSLGKRALGIKVVRSNGDPVELWRLILLRNVVVQFLAQLCGLVGLVDAVLIFNEERKCLHDFIADTIVVDVPPPS